MNSFPDYLVFRDPFFNLPFFFKAVLLLIITASIAYLFISIRRTFSFWNKNGGRKAFVSKKSISFFFKYGILKNRISANKNLYLIILPSAAGIILVWLSSSALLFDSILRSAFDVGFLYSSLYKITSFFSDLGFLMCLFSAVALLIRKKISAENESFRLLPYYTALVIILFFALTNSTRIALMDSSSYESAAFLSILLSKLFASMSEEVLSNLNFFFMWTSFSLLAVFAAVLFTGRTAFLLKGWMNIFHTDPQTLKFSRKYILPVSSKNEIDSCTVKILSDQHSFISKDFSDSDSCINCSLCDISCPALVAESSFSPSELINSIRNVSKNDSNALSSISNSKIFSCVNCGACSEACPVFVDFNSMISRIKKDAVLLKGIPDRKIRRKFDSIEQSGNIFARGGEVSSSAFLSAAPVYDGTQEYLLFTGCKARAGKAEKTLEALSAILSAASVTFGVLKDETCCGDYALRNGDEYLFSKLAEKNISSINEHHIPKILFICPHGYNVFKKEYKSFAKSRMLKTDYKAYSHIEVISTLIENGKIVLKRNIGTHTAFHDSCFLGRYNGIYEEPRKILKAAAGIFYVEPTNSREKSFCCGYFAKSEDDECGEISKLRTREIHSSGAVCAVTSCPHCAEGFSRSANELQIDNFTQEDFAETILRLIV
ncbi:MAG: (Fe-S)-binding protein [Spirochaetes bacterium]|nr:(Fe-S)-binding protein [Spirochaetota bacterium]